MGLEHAICFVLIDSIIHVEHLTLLSPASFNSKEFFPQRIFSTVKALPTFFRATVGTLFWWPKVYLICHSHRKLPEFAHWSKTGLVIFINVGSCADLLQLLVFWLVKWCFELLFCLDISCWQTSSGLIAEALGILFKLDYCLYLSGPLGC